MGRGPIIKGKVIDTPTFFSLPSICSSPDIQIYIRQITDLVRHEFRNDIQFTHQGSNGAMPHSMSSEAKKHKLKPEAAANAANTHR
jgi:hypothetical protein